MVGPAADPPTTEPWFLASYDGERAAARGAPSYHAAEPPDAASHGPFATWTWDGTVLRAGNDRFGFRPLYYAVWDGCLAISPCVSTLLALGAPPDLDEPALAVFLRLGFYLGEDTPFRAIRALPPNATLEWQDGRLHVSGHRAAPRPQPLSRSAAIDGYVDLFRAAIARRLVDDDVAVPLSGGRDSRHILLELCRVRRKPRIAVTMRVFPPRSGDDAAVAAQLAATLGVAHVVLPRCTTWLDAEVRKNRRTGFCADEHAWILPLADYLRGRVRCAYDGIGGDVLSSGLFLSAERLALFDAGRIEQLAVHLLSRREVYVARLLRSQWAARLGRDVAVARLARELARDVDAPNPVGSFFFWNRTRREIALSPYRVLGAGVEMLCPYLDHDLYDFLAALPAASLLDRGLHSDTIRRAYPEYRDLPYAPPTWVPRPGDEIRRRARELAAYAARAATLRARTRLARSTVILALAAWSAVDGDAGRFRRVAPNLAIYLLQLARAIDASPAGEGAAGRLGTAAERAMP
jgi:asparagine synthase (glutamine-hydrolysing)